MQLAAYTIPSRDALSIDLSADQCTMLIYYGSESEAIGRFDVCCGIQLSDLPIAPELFSPNGLPGVRSFRILRDGTLLIPVGFRAIHLTSSGDLLGSYAVAGLDPSASYVEVALDPSGTKYWLGVQVGTQWQVFAVDATTSQVVAGPFDGFAELHSLAVSGEPRAALLIAQASIPALSNVLLAALGLTVIAFGMRRLG